MVTIFDLDETLVCNTYNPSTSLETFTLISTGFSEHLILRPYAKRVLFEAKAVCGEVYLATFSPRGRVERVLKTLGIGKYFDKMFTRENFDPVYRQDKDLQSFFPGECVLVDDRGADSPFTAIKAKFFGIREDEIENHLILVSGFDGNDTDRCLLTVMEEIRNRFPLVTPQRVG